MQSSECPKCAYDELTLIYDPGPPERLRTQCVRCGFQGSRPCADAGDPVKKIQTAVAKHYRLTIAELLSYDRHKTVARARQIACYFCRTTIEPAPSFPELGRRFGGRDHTTIMSAVKRGEQIVAESPWLRALVHEDVPDEQLQLPGIAKTTDDGRRFRVA